MASGAFFDPKTALLVAPLISSTCSFWFALDEEYFLRIFTTPAVRRAQGDTTLPFYFKHFFDNGVLRVLGLLGITISTSLTTIYRYRGLLESRGSLWWYAGAAALAFGHLAYIPAVAPSVAALRGNAGASDTLSSKETLQKSNVEWLEEWLRANLIRTWTTDVGAWLCCVVAVGKTVRA
jgi:hypothetical protein